MNPILRLELEIAAITLAVLACTLLVWAHPL